jgi:3-hydroxyanthranilate 3,4-dioxygenase
VGHYPPYAEYFVLQSIERDFPPRLDRFFGSVEHRTCDTCGVIM